MVVLLDSWENTGVAGAGDARQQKAITKAITMVGDTYVCKLRGHYLSIVTEASSITLAHGVAIEGLL